MDVPTKQPRWHQAAHIIPVSEGGAASTSSVRILRANRHAAYDASLIVLDGDQLVRAPGAAEVAPAPGDQTLGARDDHPFVGHQTKRILPLAPSLVPCSE